jgi:multicomponent K+:H+ antiporter subunit G
MDANVHPVIEAATAFFLVVGAFFLLVGALGLARLPDFFMRLHSPTKASTLGVGGMLIAAMLWSWGLGVFSLHELLITLFVFVTAPVSANLLAKAALHLRVASRAPLPDDARLRPPADTPDRR